MAKPSKSFDRLFLSASSEFKRIINFAFYYYKKQKINSPNILKTKDDGLLLINYYINKRLC